MVFFLVQLCGSLRSCTHLPSARFCLLLCLTVRTPPPASLFGCPGTNCKQAAAAQGQFVRCVKIMKARVKWARVKRCRKRAAGRMGKQRAKRSQSHSLSFTHTLSSSLCLTLTLRPAGQVDATPEQRQLLGPLPLPSPVHCARAEILRKPFIMSPMAAFS